MKLNATNIALAGVTFLLGAGIGLAATDYVDAHRVAALSGAQPVATVEPLAPGMAPNYREIVARNTPAVVGITGEQSVNVAGPFWNGPFEWGIPQNDPFFRFFRDLPIPRGNLRTRSMGSGFIINSDGLILTNAHVVRDAKQVTVKLSDRREFQAKVLGSDPVTDIAVLKIDAHDLPTVRLGNSDGLAVGDYVLAIGQPYGFEESATAGIVSAKGRSLPGDAAVPFIQTDVAVNPGNSGGPLFDSRGTVVGINAQIYTTTGGYEGLSFAIPIDVALHAEKEIVRNGKVAHARLGVDVQSLTLALASSFARPDETGALVAEVMPASAAALAGLKPGDVILSYNHQPVVDAGDLSGKVGMAAPGDNVTLEVWRDRKLITARAELRPATPLTSVNESTARSSVSAHGELGLEVRPLTPDERAQAGVGGGLLVQEDSGPAGEAGIEAGDIILSVDDTAVASANQMRAAVSAHQKEIALLVQRGSERLFFPVQLG